MIKHYLAAILWSLAMFAAGFTIYKADSGVVQLFFGCLLMFLVLGFYDVIDRLQKGK